jgi:hypothetical protein
MSGQIPTPVPPQSTDNRRNDGNPIWRNTIHVPKVIVAIPNMPASKYRFADSVSIRQSSGENVRHAAKIEKIIETNPPDTTTEDIFSSADQDSGKNLMGVTPGCPLSLSLVLCGLHDTAHRFLCQLFLGPDTELANRRAIQSRATARSFPGRRYFRRDDSDLRGQGQCGALCRAAQGRLPCGFQGWISRRESRRRHSLNWCLTPKEGADDWKYFTFLYLDSRQLQAYVTDADPTDDRTSVT